LHLEAMQKPGVEAYTCNLRYLAAETGDLTFKGRDNIRPISEAKGLEMCLKCLSICLTCAGP
jgi:hypothetical protein